MLPGVLSEQQVHLGRNGEDLHLSLMFEVHRGAAPLPLT